ncbi:hypothetical protein appser13_17860 [Actinobacillus pleuropneumoniae serovar 13 str. N273]|nr:hypothetical protein appser2_17210 [Actinobacillus pleuropneumoniae serovar 2 str. S1536]EFM95623.1 hypothetical protein appser10_17760 [Actinobacillus pleuropneumoniae serovar 10 str. D13039]EFN02038.1 hypothetical protein appser13_17860 [Actinobacillus pleuropneumoniae serovar 13 str. N273]
MQAVKIAEFFANSTAFLSNLLSGILFPAIKKPPNTEAR